MRSKNVLLAATRLGYSRGLFTAERVQKMKKTIQFLSKLGIGSEEGPLPSSPKRFADGTQYRIEIPSVESPEALAAVLEESAKHDVPVHRVSQGSGIMLLTDREIGEMARLSRNAKVELCLFTGPRAGYDTTPQPLTQAGKVIGGNLRGSAQIAYAIEDVKRACALGVRSVLVADLGLLWVLGEMKKAGELPANLVLKISILLSIPNPATAKVIETLGAGSLNVSPDLTLAHLSAIRQATTAPMDVYVEVPDNFGGYIRYYEVPELVRVAAPVYVKLGLRNAPDIYPCGQHLLPVSIAMCRERIHRARIAIDMIQRYYPEASVSKAGASGLAIPE